MAFLSVMFAQRLGCIDLLFVAFLKELMMRKLLPLILCALHKNMAGMVIEELQRFFTLRDGKSIINGLSAFGESKDLRSLRSNLKENAFI
jgi:predicted Na+-dependent transporter